MGLAIGFSAGGYLVASGCANSTDEKDGRRPDAIALVYPCIDATEWGDAATAGFWNTSVESPQAKSCLEGNERLLPGPFFAAPPPTFIVSSTGDDICPPARHADQYVKATEDAGVPVTVLRGDLGSHGFG